MTHKTIFSFDKKNLLSYILIAALLANIIMMGWFLIIAGGAISQAAESLKPQTGTLTLISTPDCDQCGDATSVKNMLQKAGADITDEIVIPFESDTAQELIKTYAIKQLPSVIFTSDKKLKPAIAELTTQGARDQDGTLVWEKTFAPFISVETGMVEGLVDVTYITDNACEQCYDVFQTQRSILLQFGMAIQNETLVDIASESGKELLKTYTIEAVPTMILSQGASQYPPLVQVWPSVGTVEEDGMYVFRKPEVLNVTYKNLTTGKTITAPTQ